MSATLASHQTFVLSTFLAFKSAEGSYGPISSTDVSANHPLNELAEHLKCLVEDGYVLDPRQNPNPTNKALFLVIEVAPNGNRPGWKVWCQITQAVGLEQVIELVLAEFDESTRSRFYGHPS